jgi:NAD-dependent DNA ligase
MVGRRLGKVLAKELSLQPDDLLQLPSKLSQIKLGEIEGLGVSKLGEVHCFAYDPEWASICSRLYAAGVRPTPTAVAVVAGTKTLEGTTFVITGEFDSFGARESITARLEALGAVSKSGVSKNVNLLLVGAAAGKSKLTKAAQLGVRQVGAEWLAKIFATN